MSDKGPNIDELFRNKFKDWEAPYDPYELDQSWEEMGKHQPQAGNQGGGSSNVPGSGFKGLISGMKGWIMGGVTALVIGSGAVYFINLPEDKRDMAVNERKKQENVAQPSGSKQINDTRQLSQNSDENASASSNEKGVNQAKEPEESPQDRKVNSSKQGDYSDSRLNRQKGDKLSQNTINNEDNDISTHNKARTQSSAGRADKQKNTNNNRIQEYSSENSSLRLPVIRVGERSHGIQTPHILVSDTITCPGSPISLSKINFEEDHQAMYRYGGEVFKNIDGDEKIIWRSPGHYELDIKVSNGIEEKNTTLDIQVKEKPEASFDYRIEGYQKVAFENYSVLGSKYEWYFGDGEMSEEKQPIHSFRKAGKKSVLLVAVSEFGCKDSFGNSFYLEERPNLEIPNIITPNGDGKNDRFIVKIGDVSYYHLIIRNQYGNKVFETHDASDYWNGTVNNNGKPCNPGSYQYVLKYKYPGQKEAQTKGGKLLLKRKE